MWPDEGEAGCVWLGYGVRVFNFGWVCPDGRRGRGLRMIGLSVRRYKAWRGVWPDGSPSPIGCVSVRREGGMARWWECEGTRWRVTLLGDKGVETKVWTDGDGNRVGWVWPDGETECGDMAGWVWPDHPPPPPPEGVRLDRRGVA